MARIVEEIVLKTTMETKSTVSGAKDIANSMNQAEQSTNAFQGALTGLKYVVGLIGLKRLATDAKEVAIEYDKMDKTLQSVFGSQEKAGAQMQMLTAWSEKLGLSLTSSAKGYAQISASARGTSLEGKGVEDIFKGVTMASTSLGLSADETSGALRAISQIMSKGKVQAEELRGQLGERIPGAFQIAARAMNMTTSELDKFMADGKLLSEEFLPEFARQLTEEFAGSAEMASDSMVANANRMRNAWEDAIKGMGALINDLTPIITKAINQFSEGIEEFRAMYNWLFDLGEFDPSANNKYGPLSEEERMALADSTAEKQKQAELDKERSAELQKQLDFEKQMKTLKSLDDFALKMQESVIADRIAKSAGLTKSEYQQLRPAMIKAIQAGADEAGILEGVVANVQLYKDELNSIKAPDLQVKDPFVDMLKNATLMKDALNLKDELNLTAEEFDKVKGAIAEAINQDMSTAEISSYIEGLRDVGFFGGEGKKKESKMDGRVVATALQVGTKEASDFLKGNEVLFNQLDIQKQLLKETKKGNKNSPMIVTKDS